MHMLEHRLQILLDEERLKRITEAARERGVSVATIVREAIDRGVPSSDSRRRKAGTALLAAQDMDVPDVSELLTEIDALRGRRG